MKESVNDRSTIPNRTGVDSNIFKSLFENSLNGILYGNPESGDICDANPAAASMFGYSIEELIKLNRRDVFDANHPSMINALKSRSKDGQVKGELVGIRKNGQRFPIEFTSSVFFLENGEQRTTTILNDITERRKSEEEMTLLLDNTEESFVLIDKELRIVSFNKKFENNIEYYFKVDVLKGANILKFAQEERRGVVKGIYDRVFEGEIIDDVIIVPSRNETVNYFSTRYKPAIDANGNIVGAFFTSRDITEKRKAIHEKEFEQRNKEALINSTSDLIWSVDKEFKLIAANQAFIKTMKVVGNFDLKSGDSLLFGENFDPDFIAFWKQMYVRGFSGEAFKFETQTPKGYPNVVYLETTINPILEGDSIVGLACYSRDITELKRAHEELKTSYDLFEKLTLKLPTAIFQFEINADGKMSFPYMSKGMNKLNPSINLELLKVDASSAFLTVHPDDIAPMKASIEYSKNTLTNWEFEYRSVISKDHFIWMKGMSTPEKKEDGTIVWYGYFQDITEKRRVHQQLIQNEQEIKSSHEQLTKLTESVDTVVYQFEMTADNKMTFPFISKSATKLIPRIDIELLKQDATAAFAHVHPDDLDGLIKSIYESRDNLSDWNYEYRSVVDSEKEIWIKGASHPELKENGTVVWYGYFLDITERKIDNENLLRANERYDMIAKATNDTIWDCDLVANKIYWAKGILGYTLESIDTSFEWWFNKIHPEDVERVKRKLDLVIKNRELRWEDEFRFMAADGAYKYVHDKGFLVIYNSLPIRMIGAMQDITERKNNEIEREQIIAELSQNNKDLKQFSYVTSHNLRAPIANLLGLTSLIDQYKIPNKSLKQILDGVRQSALMFDDTVKDLSKVLVIKDQTNIVKEKVSFAVIVDNVLKQLGVAVDDNTVNIKYKFTEAPTVLFTPSYMESILLNLFTNAIRYKSSKRQLKIDISSSNTREFVILKFKDNGIGIDTEKYKDKLFKLYQRFHDNPDGKGLGLYLIKSQLEALGGSINIESEVDKGTTFTINFKK